MMRTKVDDLVQWLDENRGKLSPYSVEDTKRYFRIVGTDGSAYCFVVRKDFENKSVGSVKAGDLMRPATYVMPAKIVRGNLFGGPKSWAPIFGEWGMKRNNTGRMDISKHSPFKKGQKRPAVNTRSLDVDKSIKQALKDCRATIRQVRPDSKQNLKNLSSAKITAISKLFDSFTKLAALAKGKDSRTGRPKKPDEGPDPARGDKDYLDGLSEE